MKTILQNPKGLHKKYQISKIVPLTREERSDFAKGLGLTYLDSRVPHYKTVDPDPNSEYFVLRLDLGASDINHTKACRIGINAYADAIAPFIPQLAADLKDKYPLI